MTAAIQRTNGGAPSSIVARLSEATGFNRAQVEIIKDTIAKGASDDELMVFMMLAKRTGLDPFSRQIYLIERRSRENGEWKTTRQPMTGIDGLRLTADRTGNYAPGRAPTFEYDQDGRLLSATAYIWKHVRGDWREVAATAHYAEYVQTKQDGNANKFWGEKPHIMLAKCAEALALRRAFPADLSGLYTTDEVADDQPVVIQHQPGAPRLVAPSAPPAEAETGEVQDTPAEAETGEVQDTLTIRGVVEGEPNAKFSPEGRLGVNFKVSGYNYVIIDADPALAHLEAGDEVILTAHPETIKGRPYNVVDSLWAEDEAGAPTNNPPWRRRATAA